MRDDGVDPVPEHVEADRRVARQAHCCLVRSDDDHRLVQLAVGRPAERHRVEQRRLDVGVSDAADVDGCDPVDVHLTRTSWISAERWGPATPSSRKVWMAFSIERLPWVK